MDYNLILDKLLDMNPDPIPRFVLLKEFKGTNPDSAEYQNAYEKVCEHRYVKEIMESQIDRGFWPSYHGDTEGKIRRLLWFGIESKHICLQKALQYSFCCLRLVIGRTTSPTKLIMRLQNTL